MFKLSKQTIEMMWRDCDVPINDYEEIDEDWCGWERFTPREDIWRWFDEQYALYGGVHALMFPNEHKRSKYGSVKASVDLQVWMRDYAFTFETHEFDCAPILDEWPLVDVKCLEAGKADELTDEIYLRATCRDFELVKSHDGPFDCRIVLEDELETYIKAREEE